MTKIYGIYGYRELNIRIPLGNGRNFIQREFTRGNPQQGAYYKPATYISSDRTEQAMIESSPMFGRQIKLIRTCDDGPEDAQQPKPEQQFKAATARTSRTSRTSRGPVKVVAPASVQEPDNGPAEDSEAPAEDNVEEYDEITSREDLIAFLKTRGAKAAVLLNDDKMVQFIAEHNLSFPNLNM